MQLKPFPLVLVCEVTCGYKGIEALSEEKLATLKIFSISLSPQNKKMRPPHLPLERKKKSIVMKIGFSLKALGYHISTMCVCFNFLSYFTELG